MKGVVFKFFDTLFLFIIFLVAATVAYSITGADPLLDREGHRNEAYLDVKGVPTICAGHTSDHAYPFKLGDTWSDEKCRAVYLHDRRQAVDAIERLVTVPLEPHQYTALTSFVFNIGNGAFADSTLLELLNLGLYDAVPYEMRRWNKITVNGVKVVSRGLVNRRESEVKEWLGEL
jgi:lysozyme